MGEKTNGIIGEPNGEVKPEGAGSRAGRSGSATTTASSTGQGAGAGAGTGAGTGAGAGAGAKEKQLPKMAVLTDEEQKKKDEKNAKRREAYAKKKAEGGAKPKKVNKKKAEEPIPLDADSLKGLIITISTLVASRPGNEHWLLSEKEVESIIVPLNKMLAESELFKGAGAYSNQIALVIACVTIFVPRIFITISKASEKKKREVTGNVTDTAVRPERNSGTTKTEANGTTGRNNRPATVSGKNNVNSISWAGSPIA